MYLKNRINNQLSGLPKPFEFSKEEQIKKMNGLGLPVDLLDRSIKQFQAQFLLLSKFERVVKNIVGFFAIPYFLILAFLGQFKKKIKVHEKPNLAIFPYKNFHYPGIIPIEIEKEFEIEKVDFMEDFLFNSRDMGIVSKIIKNSPLSFYFVSKCISKLFFYRYIIDNYHPKAILSSSEYSFTSSIATLFCKENSVEHINLMHGEKFFFLRDSFFEFDRFYIWDDHYKDLFVELNANPDQFKVGTFTHLQMRLNNTIKIYNYTYYLAAETNEELLNIKSTLEQIDDVDKICIRYHPRYSTKENIEEVFNGFNIENPKEVSLEESFSRTKSAISLYSSCLTQAYFNGINVVIDDLNHPKDRVEKLKELGFIIFSKPHTLLNTLVGKKEKTIERNIR